MTQRTVRVTRTWDVAVEAEYGDDYASLCAKVTEEVLDQTAPDAENRVVLEEHESPFDKWHERPDAAVTASALADRNERLAARVDAGDAMVEQVEADRAEEEN